MKRLAAFVLLVLACGACSGGGNGHGDADAALEVVCEEADSAEGSVVCDGSEEGQGACGNGIVETGEECDDGANGVPDDGCRDDCRFTCRAATAAGDCDDGHGCTADTCDEESHACSSSVAAAGTVCRPAAGACDVEERCDGAGADCPQDAFKAAGEVCRPAAGECDAGETCPGTAGACPSDMFQPAWKPCADGDGCTGPDVCDGGGRCAGIETNRLYEAAAVSPGGAHTCALLSGGGVRCWGGNTCGGLGDGTTTGRLLPVAVAGLAGGAADVQTGGEFSCAVVPGGAVACWGCNGAGQLGDGTTQDRATPAAVAGMTAGTAALAAGELHACALTTGGGLRCWGENGTGQLGNGSSVQSATPVGVAGLSSGAAAVTAGGAHTCALLSGGAVRCWGSNVSGQLGSGAGSGAATPVVVAGISSGALAVAAGMYHTCALLSGGAVRCWGDNMSGQLGDGTQDDRETPVPVGGLGSGVAALAAGGEHTCALLSGGTVKCWGKNARGQLGDGTTTRRTAPAAVVGISSAVLAVAAGKEHTCALLSGGAVRCWGMGDQGQLGTGGAANASSPVGVRCE